MSDDRPVPPFENDPFASRKDGPPDVDGELLSTDTVQPERMKPTDWILLIVVALVAIVSALALVLGAAWVIKQVSFAQCVSNAQSIGAEPAEVCQP